MEICKKKETEKELIEAGKIFQQRYYEELGDRDWDCYTFADQDSLKKKIAFAFFELPKEQDEKEQTTNDPVLQGYNKKQTIKVEEMFQIINKYRFGSRILMRIVFIYMYRERTQLKGCTPVFGVKTPDSIVFIDNVGRCYTDWNHFKDTNEYQKCYLIAPLNGHYLGEIINNEYGQQETLQVKLEYFKSPAYGALSQTVSKLDIGSTVASVATLPVVVAAAIPAVTVAPAVLAGTLATGAVVGVYSMIRNIGRIVDRSKHEQSIGLEDAESRRCWFSVGLGGLSIAAPVANAALARSVQSGIKIGTAAKTTVDVINVLNIAGSGAFIVNSSIDLITDMVDGNNVSKLQVLQLSASILFFCNSVSTFRSANCIINETQSSTINEFKSTLRSNRHRKLFDKALKESQRVKGAENGNTDIISGMKNINNPDNYFASVAKINKQLNKNKARFTIGKDGNLEINGALRTDPTDFHNLGAQGRSDVLNNIPGPDRTVPNVKSTNITSTSSYLSSYLTVRDGVSTVVKGIVKEVVQECLENGDKEKILQMVTDKPFDILLEICYALLDIVAKELSTYIPSKTGQSILMFCVEFIKIFLKKKFEGLSFKDALKETVKDGKLYETIILEMFFAFDTHFKDTVED